MEITFRDLFTGVYPGRLLWKIFSVAREAGADDEQDSMNQKRQPPKLVNPPWDPAWKPHADAAVKAVKTAKAEPAAKPAAKKG